MARCNFTRRPRRAHLHEGRDSRDLAHARAIQQIPASLLPNQVKKIILILTADCLGHFQTICFRVPEEAI